MGLRRECVVDVGDREDAVGVRERAELHAHVARGGGVLVPVDVRALSTQHLGTAASDEPQRELVRHRPGRHVERGFLAE